MPSVDIETPTASPEVVHHVREACAQDLRATAEVLGLLSEDQRRGLRSLPDPLPLVPSIQGLGDALVLDPWERDALLVAAVCIDDRMDVLLDVIGRSMDDVLASTLSAHLALVAGRFAFADARMRIWAHESATLNERTRVHERLVAGYTRIGDARRSLWHRALSTMQGDPALANPLLLLSADAERTGDGVWAYAVAREAASHADARVLDRARVAAGRCALGAGWLEDALDWFRPVIGGDDLGAIRDALPAFVVASTVRHGVAPSADLLQHRPNVSLDPRWSAYGRAVALAASLSAERGHRTESRQWFVAVREIDSRAGRPGRLTMAVAEWCALFAGAEQEMPEGGPPGPAWALSSALRLGLDGDPAAGLRLLAGSERVSGRAKDSLIVGRERSRLMHAHRAVAEAILRFWSGDLRASRSGLEEAALRLPIALPFAGVAVSLARRLELAIDGHEGALSAALDIACPATPPGDRLVDLGLKAYLEGDSEQAAAHLRLWVERGAPSPAFVLPGLDEVGPVELPDVPIAPPDALRARALRRRIRAAREHAWERDHREAAEASREIVSPFERARVEALLGTVCATRGENAPALRHLRAARTLFSDAGADAWTRSVDMRLSRFGEQGESAAQPVTAPIPVSGDPLGVCRTAWEPLLTERELAVAMLVADGCTNREIAARLVVSVRTVEVHLGRVFVKLDIRGRGELIALAHRTSMHL
ncbi:helix-turn-helix transcriptional regulator [Microbacterium pseudoresistens]|uniref:DNA-binding CsgD family transcriptional regulator n=1 Tax=Microbacterium pseudoresistens TaxID=640634 RepID=A0A7Y9EW84_9MICO|nr:helix-turn-helix transcriptional regulator [Microbacterium pseudoresistens]NYD55097.1 DNA-binding CsgD family transcriptional regulator [Microbacterium pseudoresistens]